MKILILSDDFPPKSFGGAGIVAFEQARELVRRGYEVNVITTTQERGNVGRIVLEGMTIYRLYANYHERFRAYRSLYNTQTISQVKMILREISPNVVHAHNIHNYLSYHCLKIAKQSGAKVFLTAHDVMLFHYGKLVEFIDFNDVSCPDKFDYKISVYQQIKKFRKRYNPLRNLIIRYYLGYVDRIFAVSVALKTALNQNGIKNVDVIYNGIDVDQWHVDITTEGQFKGKHNLGNKKIILFGGRVSGAKGGYQAILALEEVFKKIPEATLLIMGDENAYTKKLISIAKEKGIDDHLVFTGWIMGDELKASYQVSNLLIMPSVCFDTFGMVCLEAMACKKPVIATCFGGAREVVIDGQTGFIVNPLNVGLLSEKIIDLLASTSKAEKFGVAGYKRAKQCFNLSEKVGECVSAYQDIGK